MNGTIKFACIDGDESVNIGIRSELEDVSPMDKVYLINAMAEALHMDNKELLTAVIAGSFIKSKAREL